jgi:hypothetical protein
MEPEEKPPGEALKELACLELKLMLLRLPFHSPLNNDRLIDVYVGHGNNVHRLLKRGRGRARERLELEILQELALLYKTTKRLKGRCDKIDRNAWTPDLVSVREEAWRMAVKRFKILKPLIERGHTERTFAEVNKIALGLGKHPSTIYRWIEDYERTERLSIFLRKERSDRGKSRLPDKVNAIIGAPLGVEHFTVFSPKECLSQACRERVIKANDIRRRNHHRIRILLHGH